MERGEVKLSFSQGLKYGKVLQDKEEKMYLNINLLGGNSSSDLLGEIMNYMTQKGGWNGFKLTPVGIERFQDGEPKISINDNLRGNDVFIVQSTCPPVAENLLDLLLLIDTCVRSDAGKITAVIPYFGLARQDRKVRPRVPISAALACRLLKEAGADRLVCLDLHAGQIQGFFPGPFDNLTSRPAFRDYIRQNLPAENLVVVAPDAGGGARAEEYAKIFDLPVAYIDKRRDPKTGKVKSINVVGDVGDKKTLIVDDIIDTAGTIIKGVEAIKKAGGKEVFICATHAVLSGQAVERIMNSPITQIIVSDSIPLKDAARQCPKIKVVSIAPIVAEAIRRIHTHESVSSLFD